MYWAATREPHSATCWGASARASRCSQLENWNLRAQHFLLLPWETVTSFSSLFRDSVSYGNTDILVHHCSLMCLPFVMLWGALA